MPPVELNLPSESFTSPSTVKSAFPVNRAPFASSSEKFSLINRLLDAEPSESVFAPRLIVVTERLSLLLIVKLLTAVTDEVDVCRFPPSLLTSEPKTSSVLFM